MPQAYASASQGTAGVLPPEVPVLIVGAGPTGAMAALLLEQLGIETRIVERRAEPQRAPAAHVVNARTFEICRAAGVDMQAVAGGGEDPPPTRASSYWVTKLGGQPCSAVSPSNARVRTSSRSLPRHCATCPRTSFEPLRDAGIGTQRYENAALERCQWQSAVAGQGTAYRLPHTRPRERRARARRHVAATCSRQTARAAACANHSASPCTGPDRLQTFVMIHLRANAARGRLRITAERTELRIRSRPAPVASSSSTTSTPRRPCTCSRLRSRTQESLDELRPEAALRAPWCAEALERSETSSFTIEKVSDLGHGPHR